MLGTIKENGLIEAGESVMVALSGGPDSVALLHGLLRLKERLSFSLSAAHLNHKLRGRESDEDEDFVRKMAEENGVPLLAESRDVKRMRGRRGGSVEEVARDVRYEFLRKAARRLGATKIALGHNMNDNAETVVMNLLRGSGLKGLSGIRPYRREGEFVLIRPLLEVTRKEILSFLKREKLAYREDVSNLDTALTRNRVRRELLPLLAREYNPRIERVLSETGRNLREAEESLSAAMEELEKECVRTREGGLSVNVDRLREHAPVVRRELLRRMLQERLGVSPPRGGLELVCQLAAGTRAGSVGIGKGLVACREYGELLFLPEEKLRARTFEKKLRIPCSVFIRELGLEVSARSVDRGKVEVRRERPQKLGEVWRRVKEGEKLRFVEFFDASKIGPRNISVRTRREGDAFRPVGMGGRRKVKELFIDEKVPATLRDRIPIFCCGEEIIWIAGYRVAAKFAVKKSTRRVLRVAAKVSYCRR